ncbi:hypothetical protein [Flammeovirga pacifica]|uniref:Uncharacterized protein n=1 Tax=Flammeovirga pacifica TaxID=915059 RepID=A0A1S1Z415_FLAPC|nr:hypothetical protein [Flammeovirga pacifica]OHX68028.1 hypothetical protein NH26_17610 [Flammeovirga pacifica]
MKQTILVALGAAFFIIGVHQTFHYGIPSSYWLFMLSGACFLLIQLSKKAPQKQDQQEAPQKKSSNKKHKKKK